MPPEGKGTPLTSEQVAPLRAWIDQGAAWDLSEAATQSVVSVAASPAVGVTIVHGDKSKFRELEWRPDGWDGGLESFGLTQTWPDGRAVTAEGHLLRDDYKLTLELRKPDLGFTRLGFEQYRKYYDDAGGYYGGFSPPLYRLGEDLHLDIGRAWVEVGLTLPNWPRIVAGYEHQYRDGSKSMLSWGPVLAPSGDFLDTRSIYPSVEDIDENTHVFRLDLTYETHGFQFEDNFRAELSDSNTRRTDALEVAPGASKPDVLMLVRQGRDSTQIANTVLVQKQIFDWWLAGVGYRYSWYDADESIHLTPKDGEGQLAVGSAWSANKILLNEVWQIANANSQFRIHPQLTATVGVQGQWKRQDTFGDVNLDEVSDPGDPVSGITPFPATERSDLDQTTAEEMAVLRYTGLPFTTLFADASLKEELYSRNWDQTGGPHDVQLASDASVLWQDYRLGFYSSPWTRISFGGHYRYRDRRTDYDPDLAVSDGAYPGLIRERDVLANEVEARVIVRPVSWLKTTLTYRWNDSDFRTRIGSISEDVADPGGATRGGSDIAGRYESHTVSANLSLTPIRRLYFATTLSYQNGRHHRRPRKSIRCALRGGSVVLDGERNVCIGRGHRFVWQLLFLPQPLWAK